MKRWVLLFAASLCFSAVASAQAEDNPKLEAFVGYSYLHFEDPGNHLQSSEDALGPIRANLNGGSASISFNPFKYLGGVFDFGGYKASDSSELGGSAIYTFLAGPKVMFRTGRFTPFAQFLAGGAHFGITSQTNFAWAGGLGLDANLTRHLGVRLFQVEYLRTYFPDGITGQQNDIRGSAGVVVRF